MKCISYCLIAFMFLGTKLYNLIDPIDKNIGSRIKSTLNKEQKEAYNNIVSERLNIYINGLIIGLICGIIFLKSNPGGRTRICGFIAVVFAVKFAFYLLHPKSDYMINHLVTMDQVKAWNSVGKEMKNRMWYGSTLGAAIYFLLSYGVNM